MIIRFFLILLLGMPYLTLASELLEEEISANDLTTLVNLAQTNFNQHTNQGLSIQVNLAKQLLLENPNLIRNDYNRKLFLAQDANAAAAILCTVASRYLYLWAMHAIYKSGEELLSFPHYYLLMVDQGIVTTDSNGKLFVWLKDNILSTAPFLPGEGWSHLIQYRSSRFPTDTSLLTWVKNSKRPILFIRDSANINYGSHTFLAVKKGERYIMVDTWHLPFNGIDINSRGPGPHPYLYRFGAAGSRVLHNVSGFLQE